LMPVGEEVLMDHLNLFFREEKKVKKEEWFRNDKSIFALNMQLIFDFYAKNFLISLGWTHFYAKNCINPKILDGQKIGDKSKPTSNSK
jgi:hypothetical protein